MVVVIVVYLFILKEDRAQKVLKICPDFFFFFLRQGWNGTATILALGSLP